MRKTGLAVFAALIGIASHPADAQLYQAQLLGSNVVPANSTTASGFVNVLVTGNGQFAQFDISYAGFSSNLLSGIVTCCALPGVQSTATVFSLGVGNGLTSGSFTRSFDLSLPSTYGARFTANHPPNTAQARFLDGLNSGQVFVTLNTSSGVEGIRGNLNAVPQLNAVPEPASWAMLIAGFGLVGAALRRRRVAIA
jgi:hypothetical protein